MLKIIVLYGATPLTWKSPYLPGQQSDTFETAFHKP